MSLRQTNCLKWIVGLLVLLLLFACSQRKGRTISRGFYYWKTNVNISDYEQSYMDSLQSQYTYVRFFDVDIAADGKTAKPLAIVNFGSKLPQQKIVPVVFITPRALNVMQWHELDFYAKNIADLLSKNAAQISLMPEEIQIDCDWTQSNRDMYFELLNRLKKQDFLKNKKLSATIRLHQIKFSIAAGIPPVDKGLLMVYNIDKLTDINVENSILNDKTAKKYVEKIGNYPIPLDIALPIFSWALLFENESLKGILRDFEQSDLEIESIFKPIAKNKYLVQKDTLFRGYDLKTNQVLRFENSDYKTVYSMANYLSDRIKSDSLTLLLYHCDSINFSKYSTDELEKIFSSFN